MKERVELFDIYLPQSLAKNVDTIEIAAAPAATPQQLTAQKELLQNRIFPQKAAAKQRRPSRRRTLLAVAAVLALLTASVLSVTALSVEFRQWVTSLFYKDVTAQMTQVDHDFSYTENGFLFCKTDDQYLQVLTLENGNLVNVPIQTFTGTFLYAGRDIPFAFRYVLYEKRFAMVEDAWIDTALPEQEILFRIYPAGAQTENTVFLNISGIGIDENDFIKDPFSDVLLLNLHDGTTKHFLDTTGRDAFLAKSDTYTEPYMDYSQNPDGVLVPHTFRYAREWAHEPQASPQGHWVLFQSNRNHYPHAYVKFNFDYYLHNQRDASERKLTFADDRLPHAIYWESENTLIYTLLYATPEQVSETETHEHFDQHVYRYYCDENRHELITVLERGGIMEHAPYVDTMLENGVRIQNPATGLDTHLQWEEYADWHSSYSPVLGEHVVVTLTKEDTALLLFYNIHTGEKTILESAEFSGTEITSLEYLEDTTFLLTATDAQEAAKYFLVVLKQG